MIAKEIIGKKIGKLTVIKLSDKSTHHVVCLCDCGTKKIVDTYCIGKGTNSCGCLREKDIAGKRFHKLTAIKKIYPSVRGGIKWLCHCDCGKHIATLANCLLTGNTKSCGCIIHDTWKYKANLIGEKFGYLTVIDFIRSKTNGKNQWKCKCDCGKIIITTAGQLNSGHSKSCGCYRLKILTKHGLSRTKAYQIWNGMIQRCTHKNHKAYKDYGGRGIKICKRWLNVKNFIADMGDPTPGYSIERINNDGDYKPSNCKWIKKDCQQKNQRTNRWITFNGKTMICSDWASKLGINYYTLWRRIHVSKWPIKKAFTTPLIPRTHRNRKYF